MHTLKRTPTTEMEVTSIRLERELKERLKEISVVGVRLSVCIVKFLREFELDRVVYLV